MGFHDLAFVFSDLPQALFQRNDDDMYDRLSHRWTAAQLIGLALLVTSATYVGDPIHCWAPAHFKSSWEKYTNSFCWIRNTYYLPLDHDISPAVREEAKHPIIYYQWVSLILLALMFYFPLIVWRTFNDTTGMDMNDIIETAEKVQYEPDTDRKIRLLNFLAQQTHRYLGMSGYKKRYSKYSPKRLYHLCGKQRGNYVTLLYVFIKLLWLGNALGQLWILNFLLGQRYAYYGIQVLINMVQGNNWVESERFPRITMCDVEVRRLGNNNKYTVQCVLTINLFNEKIFLYLWFWFLFVSVMTLIGLILLIFRAALSSDRATYVKEHLRILEVDFKQPSDKKIVHDFVHKYLRADGVLLMRLVGHNTNKMTVTDFLYSCYEYYRKLPEVKRRHGSFKPKKAENDAVFESADESSCAED